MKNNQANQDPITGHVKQSIPLMMLGVLVAPLLAWFLSTIPFHSTIFSYISVPLAILLATSLIWINLRPNLWAGFLKYTSLSVNFALLALRLLSYIVPSFIVAFSIIIPLSVLITITLPMWNLRVTRLIKSELFSPSTSFGIFILKYFMPILFLGATIGSVLYTKHNNYSSGLSFVAFYLGPLAWFMALLLPFSSAHPQSPWEYKLILDSEKE